MIFILFLSELGFVGFRDYRICEDRLSFCLFIYRTTMEKEKISDDLTYNIIGCAMKVHAKLGNGFQEIIYQRALAIEMNKLNLNFARELEMPIFYDNQEIGSRRVDFLVQNEVLVELKALVALEDVHLAQGLNYLVAYKLNKGLLINFGAKSLEVKRLKHTTNKIQNTIPDNLRKSDNP
jgi:GxxExxY protein